MMGGSRGTKGIRPGVPDVGRAGDGGAGVGAVIEDAIERGVLPASTRDDGISIAERRRRALMAVADEPQGARRFIITLAYATGQPIGDVERLRLNEGLYLASLVKKRYG